MNEYEAIESFDTSILVEEAEPILGEDNEIIDWWANDTPYNDPAEDDFPEDYGQDMPTEANFNLGWGTEEGEIFNSQWD